MFAAARALAPAVLLLDEVDALAPAREGVAAAGGHMAAASGGGGGDTSARLLTALLVQMDGLSSATSGAAGSGAGSGGDGVVVLASTNRPDALDPALRRPGRLERELAVAVPEPEAREEILRAKCV